MKAIFWISVTLIFHTFIGYPITLTLINLVKSKENDNDNDISMNAIAYEPSVSFIVAAHNEERVIKKKLDNILSLDYDPAKLEIIIASDNSSDKTNEIVTDYIKNYNNVYPKITLYEVRQRKGKTNAQNEAVKIAKGEILVFSDANTMWEKESLKKLVVHFQEEKIGYVCGKTIYINSNDNITSKAESTYWNYDLFIRLMESNIYSITAGDGGIYAIRKTSYTYIKPIKCHDSSMPVELVLKNKKAIFEPKAIAYEKAGETSEDEFLRKVRMGRELPWNKYENIKKYNIFKYGWFSYLYFSHRYIRYSLYFLHPLVFITNIFLYSTSILYKGSLYIQLIFYLLSLLGYITKTQKKLLYFPYYYVMTIVAQFVAVIKTLTGKSKPFWGKAETTR